jgi:hypothetical protein
VFELGQSWGEPLCEAAERHLESREPRQTALYYMLPQETCPQIRRRLEPVAVMELRTHPNIDAAWREILGEQALDVSDL